MSLKERIMDALQDGGSTLPELQRALHADASLLLVLNRMVETGDLAKSGARYTVLKKPAAPPKAQAAPEKTAAELKKEKQAEEKAARKAAKKEEKKQAKVQSTTVAKAGAAKADAPQKSAPKPAPKPTLLLKTGREYAGQMVSLTKTYGFVRIGEDANAFDVFVPGKNLLGALPGDGVNLFIVQGGDRPSGRISRVTTPKTDFVGTYTTVNGQGCFIPARCGGIAIQLENGESAGARLGDRVSARITRRGVSHGAHRAVVNMVFGPGGAAAAVALSILYEQGIAIRFPDVVIEEAQAIENRGIPADALAGRLDLREEPIFTIDGAGTKDIDDAVSVERRGDGYVLGVHIADVSGYVTPGSPLDREAFSRGTSVYYADSVVPMLPKELSNGICSLNPDEERMALSCIMTMDGDGAMTGYEFRKSIIRSRVKGVYEEINAIFEGKGAAYEHKYAQVASNLPVMRELYEKLAARRRARGCMDINTHEAKISVDEKGVASKVELRRPGLSENIIEEFMLSANTAAAMFARQRELPFIYRVHDKPEVDRVENLKTGLELIGAPTLFAGPIPTQHELSALLDRVVGTPLEKAVHQLVLRTMAKARYEAEPKGHYSLALADYAQFTSPIRRYPDLAIHRIISASLAGETKAQIVEKYDDFARNAARQSSERELAALTAQRQCEDCYMAEYMARFVGQRFTGTVTGVVNRGLYVELDNAIEGLVPALQLEEEAGLSYVEGVGFLGATTGVGYRMGSEISILVEATDVERGRIDFTLDEPRRRR